MGISTAIEWADQIKDIVDLYASGLSTRAVGQRLGLSHTAIRKRLIAADILLRTERNKKRVVCTNGYVSLFMPRHPLAMANGYVYEHRLVMSQVLGRLLEPNEEPHHKDEDKQNNAPENLELKTKRRHTSEHHKKRPDLRGLR